MIIEAVLDGHLFTHIHNLEWEPPQDVDGRLVEADTVHVTMRKGWTTTEIIDCAQPLELRTVIDEQGATQYTIHQRAVRPVEAADLENRMVVAVPGSVTEIRFTMERTPPA